MADVRDGDGRLVSGRYRIRRLLGRGGMGVVWAADDEVLGREVAVKEVLPALDLAPEQWDELRRRTLREARAAARITHPSVVRVYDVVEDSGRPWIVMERLDPRSLADVISANGPLSEAEAARVGMDVADALRTAHREGVLHRDVKPANVMLAETGRVVLGDFGIATVEDDPTLTATGLLLGSPGFMAPERARGERPTPASDLWSLGATLFTALEGQPPFRRDGHLATLNAVINEAPPPAPHAGRLGPLIARLLERDPSRRPDAEEAYRLLRAARDRGDDVAADVVPTESLRNVPTRVEPVAARPVPTEPVTDFPTIRHRPAVPALLPLPSTLGQTRPETRPDRPPPVPAPVPVPVPQPVPVPVPGPGPVPHPLPEPEPSRDRGRSGRRVLLALAAALAVLVVLVLALILRPDAGNRPGYRGARPGPSAGSAATTTTTAPASSPSGAAPVSPGAGPSSSASRSPTGVPAGFRTYHDPSGFSIAVPTGWTRSVRGTNIFFHDPRGRSYLQIGWTTHPQPDALRDWQNQEASAGRRFPGYHLIRLERIGFRGWNAADWEFSWRASGGSLHVLDRNLRVNDHQAYALLWSVPAGEWQRRKSDFSVVNRSFRPAVR